MTREIWKTERLFSRYLPEAQQDTRQRVYYHFADMAHMPLFPTRPASAWSDSPWDRDTEFRGCTMAQAIEMARMGWPEGAEKARKLREGIRAAMPERRQLARYSVAGAVPNVARAIAGNPMHMRQFAMKATAQRPVLTILCDICTSASFPKELMIEHAAAIAAVVDVLEGDGFRCEILTVARTKMPACALEIAVQLKAPEQPCNLSVVAYGLGHPALFRCLWFAIGYADRDAQGIGSSFGHIERFAPVPDAGTFNIGAAQTYGQGKTEGRFGQILRDLTKQGCPGIPELNRPTTYNAYD